MEKPWSAKQSFRDLEEKVLAKNNLGFGEDQLKLLVETVSFCNKIVHSYDVGASIVWSKRSIGTIVRAYKDYVEKMIELIKYA